MFTRGRYSLGTDMGVRWKMCHRQPRSGSLGQEELEHVAVGHPPRTPGWTTGRGGTGVSGSSSAAGSSALRHTGRSAPARVGRRDHHLAGVGASTAVQNNGAVTMQYGWKNWLGVFAAATLLAGGLASIFHRDNETLLPQFSDGCSDTCPCGTI